MPRSPLVLRLLLAPASVVLLLASMAVPLLASMAVPSLAPTGGFPALALAVLLTLAPLGLLRRAGRGRSSWSSSTRWYLEFPCWWPRCPRGRDGYGRTPAYGGRAAAYAHGAAAGYAYGAAAGYAYGGRRSYSSDDCYYTYTYSYRLQAYTRVTVCD